MNDFVQLVPVEELPAPLLAQWEQAMAAGRPGLADFVRMMANAPDHFARFTAVNAGVRYDNHLGDRLTELVRLAVARTTGCQVCQAGRLPAAVAAGMTEELVDHLDDPSFGGFTDAERAAIRFAHKFGTDHNTIDDDDRAALKRHFDDTQLVELGLLCSLCMVGRFSMLAGLEDEACPLPH
jgi:AhpD family alkylhydroperoxidase